MKFILFKSSLEEGAKPVYLFDGEEEYFKERGEAMLREKYLAEPTLDFSLFRGETLHGGALADLVAAAQSFPFVSEKRIVKVTDFYPTEREYEQYLQKYFADPQPSTILLIVNSAPPKGKPFDLKKAPGVTWVDCSKGDDETLLRWIYTRFKRAGVRADTECCERVLRYCLADMSRIAGETEKLIAYAGAGGAISAEDVDAVVYRDTAYKLYEMTNALELKNYAKYLSVQRELLEKGADEMTLLNTLCAYYRTLLEVLLVGKSDADTARLLGMKEYAVKVNRRCARRLGERRVRECWQEVFDSINAVKGGALTAQAALLRVNAFLFFGGGANIGRQEG